MKKAIYAAVAATIAAGAAVAHPVNEPHVCGIDPAMISEWPGYGTRDNIYDRGDYFFAVEVENFSPSISYKHWNKVEAITLHHRVNKETCAVSTIEIVHPESEPEIIPEPVVVSGGGSDDGDENNEPTESRYYRSPEGTHVFIEYDKQENQVYVYHNNELIADYSGAPNWPSNYEGWIHDLKNKTPAEQEDWFNNSVVDGMGNNLTGTVHNNPFSND